MTAEQIKSWRDVLKVHPAADLFPPMSADELRELGEDIKNNGLRSRVAVIDGPDGEPILLDGRNRLDAMELVGLGFTIEKVSMRAWSRDCPEHGPRGFDPYAYVISANIHRRHLTAEKKRKVIADLLKANPAKSNRAVAEMVKDDHKKVGRVRDTLEATGALPQLEKTIGKDGKTRKQPARKTTTTKPPQVSEEVLQQRAAAAERIRALMGGAARDDIGPMIPEPEGAPSEEERDRKTCIKLFQNLTTAERKLADFRAALERQLPKGDGDAQVPLDRNPICRAWRLASEEERREFADLFGDDIGRRRDGFDIPPILDRRVKS